MTTVAYLKCTAADSLTADPHAVFRLTIGRDNRLLDVISSPFAIERSWVDLCNDVLNRIAGTGVAYAITGSVNVTDADTAATIDVQPNTVNGGMPTIADLVNRVNELSPFIEVVSVENTGDIQGALDAAQRADSAAQNTVTAEAAGVGESGLDAAAGKAAAAVKGAINWGAIAVPLILAVVAIGLVIYYAPKRSSSAAA